jgi:predicted metalloprotease
MRIIDEKEVPVKIKKRGDQWLQLLLKIPQGKAWAVTEEEAGVKATSLRMMVARLQKLGELPANYRTMTRTSRGKVTVYVINSATSTEGTERKSVSTKT